MVRNNGDGQLSEGAANDDGAVSQIVTLRLAVGLLGERDQAGWWASGFMSPASTAFLAPVFGASVLSARYHGVVEAARRVHDERIGVGRVFHLFRLPESLELIVSAAVKAGDADVNNVTLSPDAALAALRKLGCSPMEAKTGPSLLGSADLLRGSNWMSQVSSLYAAAFDSHSQCFPYFKEAL